MGTSVSPWLQGNTELVLALISKAGAYTRSLFNST